MYVTACIDGQNIHALIDTGAAASIMPLNKASKFGAGVDTSNRTTVTAWNGAKTLTSGKATLQITLKEKHSTTNSLCLHIVTVVAKKKKTC